MADQEYSNFVRRYAKRINECDVWYESIEESYKIYKEKGEDQFLTDLEEKEDFQEFCNEYYGFLREHYNACSAMMWDEFESFRTKFDSDYDKFWDYLQKELKEEEDDSEDEGR